MRTFIYGSCVSRDTFEFLPADEFILNAYVARQSLLSAFTPGETARMPSLTLDSPFQRKMVTGDWQGSLPGELRKHASDTDLILWDLCDERLGVIELSRDPLTFVTRSIESISGGLDAALADHPTLRVGDPAHLEHFKSRAAEFSNLLAACGLSDKLILLAPDWASKTTDGHPAPLSFGWTAAEANVAFAPYIDAVTSATQATVLRLPNYLVRTDVEHRWGPAPFHYQRAAYQYLASRIREFASQRVRHD